MFVWHSLVREMHLYVRQVVIPHTLGNSHDLGVVPLTFETVFESIKNVRHLKCHKEHSLTLSRIPIMSSY